MGTTMSDPRALFLHELGDIFYAEQQIVKSLPKLIDEATDSELVEGFTRHLQETNRQVENLHRVFDELGETAKGEKCPGIEGLMKEHDQFMEEHQPSAMVRDTFLTGAAARVEHYEIAAYTGLIAMAIGMEETTAARLLSENLEQEKRALDAVVTVGERLAGDARPGSAA
jgi:ferritin-like metal-binding protein YciE